MKTCSKCNVKKVYEEFSPSSSCRDGFGVWCKECNKNNTRMIRQKTITGEHIPKKRRKLNEEEKEYRRLELVEYHKNYRKNNSKKLTKNKQEYTTRIKLEGIHFYGGTCTCCGETCIEFLTLEHINGRNKNETRITGKRAWAKAKAEGYPDSYTVLCFNCNCSKGIYGSCPHTWEKNK